MFWSSLKCRDWGYTLGGANLDLRLDHVDGVARLHLQRDGLAGELPAHVTFSSTHTSHLPLDCTTILTRILVRIVTQPDEDSLSSILCIPTRASFHLHWQTSEVTIYRVRTSSPSFMAPGDPVASLEISVASLKICRETQPRTARMSPSTQQKGVQEEDGHSADRFHEDLHPVGRVLTRRAPNPTPPLRRL